jgi:hypothetical protein
MKIMAKMRPWVEFDVNNAQHREYFSRCYVTGNLGTCPVRFVEPQDRGNLVVNIQSKLATYYLMQEFPNVRHSINKKQKN